MASSNALKQWQGQWQSTSLLKQTQPVQVLLESDEFLKPKVVADFAPPTLRMNSRQIMWDKSHGRAKLSSAMRHKSAITQTGILPHKWGLFWLHCRAAAAENELLNHFLQMSWWGKKSHALEILWLQEVIWVFVTALHHKEMNLSGTRNTNNNPQWVFQHFCCHPEQQQSPTSVGIWGEAKASHPPWCGLTLTCNQSQIQLNSHARQTLSAPRPIIFAVP